MFRTTLRNLVSHKLRLALSALAIVLGVAFVAGTMIFTDTLNRTFTDIIDSGAADVDVSAKSAFDSGLVGTGVSSAQSSVPASVLDDITAVDGVEAAEGYVQTEGIYVLDADGDVLETNGAPGLGVGWMTEPSLSQSELMDGRAPAAKGEVALDAATAEKLDYQVGDEVTLLTTGPKIEATLVGTFQYGESGNLAGATMAAFDAATAQDLFVEPGRYTGISVNAEAGVSQTELKESLSTAIGAEYDVRTRAEQTEAASSSLEEGIGFIHTFLMVFAGVALFVGSFIILNTFSMLVAQRTRELALLRALGASRRQVTRSVLLEAFLLATIGSSAGLAAGYGLAHGLSALMKQFGLVLDDDLVFSAATVGWAYAVGIIVTLVAAYLPARRAAKVAPVAAMRDDVVTTTRPMRRRNAIGAISAAAATAALASGLSVGDGENAGALVGLGSALLLCAAIALSPVLAKPFIRVAGFVLPRVAGRTGHLARENALRNPRRTAATSSALMIGLALVTGFSILGASANASVEALIDDTLKADYVVSTGVGQPFTPKVAEELAAVDGVESVAPTRFGAGEFDGTEATFAAFEPGALNQALQLEFADGDVAGLADSGLLVDRSTADTEGWELGDTVELLLANGKSEELTVGGIYRDNDGVGSVLVSMETYNATGGAQLDRYVYVNVADDADAAAVRSDLEQVTSAYPVVQLKDSDAFKDEQKGQVQQMLTLINALLVLSVLIAVLGVVNTLALSVIERTRELGLLRAVGMSRRQLRRMVRLESVVISVYGAALGLVLGSVFGISLVQALGDLGIGTLQVPAGQLLGFLLLGAVIGVVAATFPARRAGRLKVLDAIAAT